MGACKQAIIGTPQENDQELFGGDPAYEQFYNQPEVNIDMGATEDDDMKLEDVYPNTSSSLKAADLQGKEVQLEIAGYEVVGFDDEKKGKQNKIVLSFLSSDKTLVCNKTNGRRIAEAYGDDLETWAGKVIILYPDKTDFNGSLVDCLRVRIPVEASSKIPF